jgi:hypothetical protein
MLKNFSFIYCVEMQIKIKYNHFNAKSEDVKIWNRELDEKSKWVVEV